MVLLSHLIVVYSPFRYYTWLFQPCCPAIVQGSPLRFFHITVGSSAKWTAPLGHLILWDMVNIHWNCCCYPKNSITLFNPHPLHLMLSTAIVLFISLCSGSVSPSVPVPVTPDIHIYTRCKAPAAATTTTTKTRTFLSSFWIPLDPSGVIKTSS